MKLRRLWSLVVLVLIPILAGSTVAQGITVDAAADLTYALPEVAINFEKQSGTRVKISFGSSGNLSAQIANGAPFDVFFSADISYSKKLETDGLTESGSCFSARASTEEVNQKHKHSLSAA